MRDEAKLSLSFTHLYPGLPDLQRVYKACADMSSKSRARGKRWIYQEFNRDSRTCTDKTNKSHDRSRNNLLSDSVVTDQADTLYFTKLQSWHGKGDCTMRCMGSSLSWRWLQSKGLLKLWSWRLRNFLHQWERTWMLMRIIGHISNKMSREDQLSAQMLSRLCVH